ncbi:MAG: serine/threonine protein kinase [Deltaproteobacteria bacterium]|nr:serine/threonine protein kinase [Deltaproteobacteria bacterium]
MNLAQAIWEPGTQFGHYEILGRLARGGMAEVWRAEIAGVEGFRRQVAIKTMRPELAVSSDLVRMFINEATIAARLNHPGIMHVFDFGQHDERYFMVMEYVPGLSLRQLGRAFRERRQRVSRAFVLRTVAAAARALAYAHNLHEFGVPLGFVHRDVSPENIMVSSTGATKLIDFGAAMTHTCPPPDRTFVGKLSYLSPERLRGEDGDPRTDIYALGIVLYEFLTGRRPYEGTNIHGLIAAGIAPDPCRLVPGLPKRLGALVLRAMALDPHARYQDGSHLADDLSDLADQNLGRDPKGATDQQVSAMLVERERSNEFDRSAAARATATLRAGTGARPTFDQPAAVSVVVNDPSESDEGIAIDDGIPADVAFGEAGRNDGRTEDDDAVETNLFIVRDPLAIVRRSLPELHAGAATGVRSVSAAACFERGLQLIAARDLTAALEQWRRASALEPERSWYRSNLERLLAHIADKPAP